MTRTLEGFIRAAQRTEDPYVMLPFEVPPGTHRIDVRARNDAGSILDFGLTDPRLEDFPSRQGFRGWSGSARDSFFVATDDATPGYLPGMLPPGRWHVVLGLAKVAAEGCRYRVDIALDSSPRPIIGPVPEVPPSRAEGDWYRGDLQSHSFHSDARGSLQDLAAAARSHRLDYLAVTDHNTVSHHRHLAGLSSRDLLLVPGEEVTSYRGHANVWGVRDWVDFRLRSDQDVKRLAEHVHDRGGLLSVNHPKTQPGCIGCDWEYAVPVGADCLEAWQGPWLNGNWESLARYDALLREGRRLTLVGGSDRHQPGWPDPDPDLLQVGSPTTWVHAADLSVGSLLAGLRSGRVFVSESPSGPRLEIRVNDAPMGDTIQTHPGPCLMASARVRGAPGDVLRWIGAGGIVREVDVTSEEFQDDWEWQPSGMFLRAEVIAREDEAGATEVVRALQRRGKLPRGLTLAQVLAHPRVRALSNPVYWRAA